MRFFKHHLLFFYHMAISYLAPVNLSYNWNFGIYALVMLVSQIISGILLVMFYSSHSDLAFISVERIMRDVQYGWLLRYIHANGASFFFIVVYLHIFRGLLYGSYIYPRQLLWASGVLILLFMIITAFLGYILPWGQMSYWGATVITNLASVVPVFGQKIVFWLWGGFSVDNPTLSKFFSLHYIFPFLIAGLVFAHVIFLHQTGSSNPVTISFRSDGTNFHPYYIIKDSFSVIIFLFIFCIFVFFAPNYLGHPDNYIPANPDLTPEHIVPEWYFLPFYAILRSIPDKSLGVIALLASIVVLFFLPIVNDRAPFRNSQNEITLYTINSMFIANAVLLTCIGSAPIEYPYNKIGKIASILYFAYFFILFIIKHILISLIKSSKQNIFSTQAIKISRGIRQYSTEKRYNSNKYLMNLSKLV